MKVRELIERLSRLDPDLTVVMPLEDSGVYCPIQRVGVDTAVVIDGEMSVSYPHEEGAFEVVRLFDADLDGVRSVRP
ncbi:hypothetical protein [Phenylobacterium sp.]|uniref:hypothetical protein n=1 Tax=Phenylobacterium sp. TaxID=1871053 RepID=UPI0025EF5A74|nr:hypothetical protein [Phenylobacterium sp.]